MALYDTCKNQLDGEKTNKEVLELDEEGKYGNIKKERSNDGTCTMKRRVTQDNYLEKGGRENKQMKPPSFTVHKTHNLRHRSKNYQEIKRKASNREG